MKNLRFGTYTLDEERHELREGDAQVHVSPKAYELLKLFLESRQRALSKADLHARLWPDTFVTDGNLASLVAELRATLGDQGRDPKFIRTVHGFGYAFAADVTDVPATIAEAAAFPTVWLKCGDRRFPLRQGDQIVGRDATADIALDSLSVSRRHARVVVAGARVTIEDLDSKNGTWLRDRRVTAPAILEDGDDIRFGSVATEFRTVLAPSPTQTADD